MVDYISREAVVRYLKDYSDKELNSESHFGMITASVLKKAERVISTMPVPDVQPLSVVAEHIKNRLYETAFNTDEPIASHAIEDMAQRIDFWIGELKDGDTND